MVSKGEIWLCNLNLVKRNNEVGKIRPVLIFQINELNHSAFPTVMVLPFSTSLIDDAKPLRYRVLKRDKLLKDSDILLTQIRAIDKSRLIEKLSTLNKDELKEIEKLFMELILN